jgi:hypothetical protein
MGGRAEAGPPANAGARAPNAPVGRFPFVRWLLDEVDAIIKSTSARLFMGFE